MIKVEDLTFEYIRRDEEGNVESINKAVDDVSFEVKKGEFVAILGRNGSGKSTLAKHINALLYPTEGTVIVNGMDTSEEDNLLEIRRNAGMVFQNPDNQIIATVVEEDVGFGPENLGVPTDEIWARVTDCLAKVGMAKHAKSSPNRLSGGQKQRVAIAGIMAMKPKCIILDEPTAMLDPEGRREVISTVMELCRQEGITVLLITHYMEEAALADKVIVMDSGSIVMSGTPRQIFARYEELSEYGLEVPQVTRLAVELAYEGIPMRTDILSAEEFVQSFGEAVRAL